MKNYLFCTACDVAYRLEACDRVLTDNVEIYSCPKCDGTLMTRELGWETEE